MTQCRNHYPRWIRCSYCDELVHTSGSRATCPECKREQTQLRERIRAMRYIPKERMSAYIIIYDPIPLCDGGFRPGASISVEEMRDMLMASICAFSVGTIVRNKAGETYKVARAKGGGLKLVLP